MSSPLAGRTAVGPPDGMTALVARLAGLDASLRSLDPDWRGLGLGALAGRTSVPLDATSVGGGDFADVLRSLTTSGPADASPGAGSAISASALAGSTVPLDVELVEPVVNARVTQGFGPTSFEFEPSAVVDGIRYPNFHDGLDLAAPLGTTVRAAAAGVVTSAGRQSDGAVVVRIRHADGSETSYGHLDPDTAVQKGDSVRAGETIGAVGLTGRTTGPHVHFELTLNGETIDPAPWIAAGRLPGAATDADQGAGAAGSLTGLDAFDAVAEGIPYAVQIRTAAVAAGVDPLLLASLVRAESGFRADAVSAAGALGLAQLMPFNVRSLGVEDPFDPAQNVRAAARYLANNLETYGRADIALAAYQAGKGSVARAGGIPASPTTRRYIDRILGFWAGYLDKAGSSAEVAR